ncbi:MAG: AbrB/MazE/SpoVT family DNA-binding domain-containing protein [Planctomycetota bacterium]|jgi:bifunctional DNA-binding transcriptional regulator/antitoxin component of YhaV-PrlF toxin-antitoxin module
MAQTRIRKDGSLRIPDEIQDALKLHPGSKVVLTVDGSRLVVEKVEMGEDPFAKAAAGPDVGVLDEIQKKQRERTEKAKDRFEELIKNPPEVKPEDNPDLWR